MTSISWFNFTKSPYFFCIVFQLGSKKGWKQYSIVNSIVSEDAQDFEWEIEYIAC